MVDKGSIKNNIAKLKEEIKLHKDFVEMICNKFTDTSAIERLHRYQNTFLRISNKIEKHIKKINKELSQVFNIFGKDKIKQVQIIFNDINLCLDNMREVIQNIENFVTTFDNHASLTNSKSEQNQYLPITSSQIKLSSIMNNAEFTNRDKHQALDTNLLKFR